jgi:transcriptional/translational regulatory protein YebC/TACO1
MVGNDPQSYIDQILTEDGVISAELKDDGSVDVVFTKERYIKACEDMLQSSKGIIDNLLEKGDYTTITSITYNDDLSEIYVSLSDYNAYQNSMDSLFKWQLGATAGLYHKFLQDNATIMIHYLDQGGNEYASESLY